MTHELAPVLIAIPVLVGCLWAGFTGFRETFNAPADTEDTEDTA